MAGGKRPAVAKSTGMKSTSLKAALVRVIVLGVAGLSLAGCASDSDTTVPAPAADERAGTVPILQAAFTSHGICYGWRLRDSDESDDSRSMLSVGSNLGDGVDTGWSEDPRCSRWIVVDAAVSYEYDLAFVNVEGPRDIDLADLRAMENALPRFGLGDDVFLDDPGWAVTRAATTLPLLAAEVGIAKPAAAPTAAPAAAPSPLPDAGNDIWRDRRGSLLTASAILLFAALFVIVGVVQRRRQLRVVVPAQRAGAEEAAGRTREKA
ncbi:hypothetical protein ABZ807_07950 [Micromonospora sp. NPDC047548]|uniref:hypothetical protein n=1 Tax=Micromonospora sp. NPDC047548 TaxID=3155624 RepID=UPI0033DF2369